MMSDFQLLRRLLRTCLWAGLLCVATSAWGQQWKPGGMPGVEPARPNGPVAIQGQILPPSGGAPPTLQLTATLQPGWHIYSLTQPKGGPKATEISLKPSNAYRRTGEFQSSPPPDKKAEAAFGGTIVESHHDQVVWSAPDRTGSRHRAARTADRGDGEISALQC